MDTTYRTCQHVHTRDGVYRGFDHCVAHSHLYCERRAHGGISYTETCLDCGRERECASNGAYSESSAWHEPRTQRAARV